MKSYFFSALVSLLFCVPFGQAQVDSVLNVRGTAGYDINPKTIEVKVKGMTFVVPRSSVTSKNDPFPGESIFFKIDSPTFFKKLREPRQSRLPAAHARPVSGVR
jgi:hypothetical protein